MMDAIEMIKIGKDFLEKNYKEDIERKGKFLEIDFNKLAKHDVGLSEQLLDNYEETNKAIELAYIDITNSDKIQILYHNLPDESELPLSEVSNQLGKFLSFRGCVVKPSEIFLKCKSAKYECPSCMPKGTPVLTPDGYKPIEKVKEVMCMDEDFKLVRQKVTALSVGIRQVYSVEARLCDEISYSIRCSGNHEWFVYRNGTTQVIQTKHLKNGDILYKTNANLHNMSEGILTKEQIQKKDLFSRMQRKIQLIISKGWRKKKGGHKRDSEDVCEGKIIIGSDSKENGGRLQADKEAIIKAQCNSENCQRTVHHITKELKCLQAWQKMWREGIHQAGEDISPMEMHTVRRNTRKVTKKGLGSTPHQQESSRQQNSKPHGSLPITPLKVTSVNETARYTEMCDLIVPRYNNFIVPGGIVTHNCGNLITVLMPGRAWREPSRCGCGRKGKFTLLNKELIKFQRFELIEVLDTIPDRPKRLAKKSVFIAENLTRKDLNDKLQLGQLVKVHGFLEEEEIRVRGMKAASNEFKTNIIANNWIPIETSWDAMKLTKAMKEKAKEMAQRPDLLYEFAQSLAPSFEGYEMIRKSLILQHVGGKRIKDQDGGLEERGTIHVLMTGGPGCYAKETLITKSDGTFIRGDDLYNNKSTKKIRIGNFNQDEPKNGEIINHFCYKNFPTKIIKTESKELTCSYEHPLYVSKGLTKEWVKAENLKVGDRVKVMTNILCNKKTYEMIGEHVVDSGFGFFMGYLVADGSGRDYDTTLYFSEDDQESLEEIKHILDMKEIKYGIYIRKPKDGLYEGRIIKRTQKMTVLGIYKHELNLLLKMDKQPIRVVPNAILQSNNDVLAKFLSGLFEGDGSISLSKRDNRIDRPKITLKSSSHQLLSDTQVLLLRFGIQSRIYCDNLAINKKEDIIKFKEKINFFSKRKRNRLEKYLGSIKDQKMSRKNKQYEKIVSIEEGKVQDVYDVEIKKYHRLITNGILSHNTGKTYLLKKDIKISPLWNWTTGKGMTKVGLVACVVRDEYGSFTLEVGPLVMADKGILGIDELEKIEKTDFGMLNNAMADEQTKITKATIDQTLMTRTSLLATSNPTHKTFNDSTAIVNQFAPIPKDILDRFDVVWAMREIVDQDKLENKYMARHMEDHGRIKQIWTTLQMRQYIAYSRRIIPLLTDTKVIKHFNEKFRKLTGKTVDEKGEEKSSHRLRGNLMRWAYAYTKFHGVGLENDNSEVSMTKDAINFAFSIIRHSFSLLDLISQEGFVKYEDMEEIPKTKEVNKYYLIKGIMKELSEKYKNAIPEVEIVNLAFKQNKNIDKDAVFTELEKLSKNGEVFQPRRGVWGLL